MKCNIMRKHQTLEEALLTTAMLSLPKNIPPTLKLQNKEPKTLEDALAKVVGKQQ